MSIILLVGVREDKYSKFMQMRHMLQNTHVLLRVDFEFIAQYYKVKGEFKMLRKGLVEAATHDEWEILLNLFY